MLRQLQGLLAPKQSKESPRPSYWSNDWRAGGEQRAAERIEEERKKQTEIQGSGDSTGKRTRVNNTEVKPLNILRVLFAENANAPIHYNTHWAREFMRLEDYLQHPQRENGKFVAGQRSFGSQGTRSAKVKNGVITASNGANTKSMPIDKFMTYFQRKMNKASSQEKYRLPFQMVYNNGRVNSVRNTNPTGQKQAKQNHNNNGRANRNKNETGQKQATTPKSKNQGKVNIKINHKSAHI